MTATVYDFRDLDLMMKLVSEANGHGGVTSHDLAAAIGLDEDVQAVSRRLAWMRRYGMLEFDEGHGRVWRLSPGGRRVAEANRRAIRDGDRVDRMPEESMVEVMAHVTSRYHRGSPMLAALLRREFLYGTRPR